jgi:TRAP-type mannitol/chloroaromatic compound transport system substrate-binding protein
MGGWFNKKINSLDDLKGLKIRMPGLGGKVLAKAGANPVNIDPGELYMAVERGVIDATEWVGPVFDKRQGLDEVAKYYYFPGWHEPGSQLELIINRDAWKLLEPDLKLIIETAAAKASLDIFAQSELQNTAAFLEMQADNSIEILEFPESVLTELRRLTALVIEEEASADTDFSKIFEAYRAFEEDYQAYRSVTEIPYRKTFE